MFAYVWGAAGLGLMNTPRDYIGKDDDVDRMKFNLCSGLGTPAIASFKLGRRTHVSASSATKLYQSAAASKSSGQALEQAKAFARAERIGRNDAVTFEIGHAIVRRSPARHYGCLGVIPTWIAMLHGRYIAANFLPLRNIVRCDKPPRFAIQRRIGDGYIKKSSSGRPAITRSWIMARSNSANFAPRR